MPVIIKRVSAGEYRQKQFIYFEKTRKCPLKIPPLLALVLIIVRNLPAQELNAWMPADAPSPAMRLISEPPPLLLSALDPSSAAMPLPTPPIVLSSVSLSPAVRLGITRQLTLGDRVEIYLKSTYGPGAIMNETLDATFDQIRDDPREWGRSARGYERRFGSEYAPMVVSNTIAFSIAAADHEDPRYSRSHEHGLWPRTRYAILHTFISQIDGGGQTFAFARVGGIYGAAFAANAWLPQRQAHSSSGLSRGTADLGSAIVFRVLREFTPDIKKWLRELAR